MALFTKERVLAAVADALSEPEMLNDHQTAEAIRDGKLDSPQKVGDFWLFDMRITGTGAAYRDSIDEWAVRDPEIWLSDEFVQRCNGLAVIFLHPEAAGLNSEEYRDRSIGSIVLPYVKGDEVRGVAKIFDEDAAVAMQSTHRSTSPGVTPPKGSVASELNDGTKVLAEGLPLILDHLAVCEVGVWDKDGPPDGIRLDALSRKDASVTAEEQAALEAKLADANRRADAATVRADAAEAKNAEIQNVADAAIESDREALEAAAKGKADKAKKDAARKDWEEKKADESDDDYEKRQDMKMDDESDEEFADRKKDRKAKKDAAIAAAAKTPVDEEHGTTIVKDSKKVLDLEAIVKRQGEQMAAQGARIAAMTTQPSIEDANAIAKTWGRWDSLYQMLNEQTPVAYPGEKPRAYLRRCADGVRKFTTSFPNYVFHDSQQEQDFGLVAESIFAEALAYSKKPATIPRGTLREIVTRPHGKTRTEFIGDSRDAFAAFMHPTKFAITQINRPMGNVYGHR